MNRRLSAAAGPDGLVQPDRLASFAVAGVTPRAVAEPASAEAAAAILALCSEEGWPVEPAGAATWLAAGRPPAEPPVVVSTVRLRTIREYEPADLVIGVEAGLSLSRLNADLAAQRQMLPLDPPAAPSATIGAIAALASAGPLRAAHGTPRDIVLGVEIVTGDGRLLHFGGRVVKNVAGYDLTRLLTGSRGTFGLITALYLRLRGLPDHDITFTLDAATASEAAAIPVAIRERMEPDALEVIGPSSHDRDWTVALRLRGSAASVEEAAERLSTMSPARRLSASDAAGFWGQLADAEAGAAVCIRLADLPARLPLTIDRAVRLTRAMSTSGNGPAGNAGWRIAAHAANGVVRTWTDDAVDGRSAAVLASMLPQLVLDFRTAGGTVTWPIATGPLTRLLPTAWPDPAELRIMRELKSRFDPAGIMSVDRHLNGI